MLTLALSLALASSLPPLVTAEGVTLDPDGRVPWTAPPVGVQLDVGAPDGIGASLVITPARYLRLTVGGLSNGVGAGGRAGVTLIAFPRAALRPLLGVDAGYVFGGQLAWLPQLLTDPVVRAALTGMTVGFVSAQLGFELGSRNVAFTLRAGLAYVNLGGASQSYPTGGAATVTVSPPTITGFLPSARLGLLFCFG